LYAYENTYSYRHLAGASQRLLHAAAHVDSPKKREYDQAKSRDLTIGLTPSADSLSCVLGGSIRNALSLACALFVFARRDGLRSGCKRHHHRNHHGPQRRDYRQCSRGSSQHCDRHTGIGDIFSARIAGNIVNDDIVGSSEFATKLAGAKLIVVLGHSECGAVKGAIDGAELGELTQLLAKIRPAVEACKDAPGEHTSKNKDFVQQVAIANAKLAAENLTKTSDVLRDLVAAKQLQIVSAMHDVATGRVTFIE